MPAAPQDVDGNGIINQIDLKQQASQICIKGGGSVEEYFIKMIGYGWYPRTPLMVYLAANERFPRRGVLTYV
jgi:hypothetical protein